MLIAITRAVGPGFANCELTFVRRQPIDLGKARAQHQAYEGLLGRLGAHVISLPAEPALPDSVFVEDAAIVLDDLAVILRLGTESRRGEVASIAQALARFRKLVYIRQPGTLEGGDVLRIGNKLFVGVSRRTNEEGFHQLEEIVASRGYEVIPVAVNSCLHLKSAVSHLGRDTLLVNPAWIDPALFAGYDRIDVAPEEPHAANALAVGGTIISPASFPRTHARLEAGGFHITPLDISELQKAESGLTCSSLLFDADHF